MIDDDLADDGAAPHHQVEARRPAGRRARGSRPAPMRNPGRDPRASSRRCCRTPAPARSSTRGSRSGKFHGVMSPTTPTGSRVISTSMPGRTDGDLLAGETQHLAGEELEDVARARGLADALRAASCPPRATAGARARPCARGSRCRRDRGCSRAPGSIRSPTAGKAFFAAAMAASRLRGVGLRILADHVVDVGRIDVGSYAGAGDPFAGDVIAEGACGHVGTPWFGDVPAHASRPRRARICMSAPAPNVQGAIGVGMLARD